MFANSRRIASAQTAAHPRLTQIVERHLREPYRRTPSEAGRAACASILPRLNDGAFVLDAGCGTGASTLALAQQNAALTLVGVDKSLARLAVGERLIAAKAAPANAILLRCELVDFWQLAAQARLRCQRQYLLYPNPWPKPDHLQRRWHAHAVWPYILALGGDIELRTNWQVYAHEFVAAAALAGRRATLQPLDAGEPLTPFERKYRASAHALFRVVIADAAKR